MRKLSSALCAAAVLAAAAVTPAFAQPAHVIVRGANPLLVAPPLYNGGEGGEWYDPTGINDDPQNPYYDPAGKFPDWRYYGPKAVDLVLARTLDRNNESIMSHMLRCQAHYSTYSAASNTYFGRNGIPVPCYL